ncbi:MAG: DUF134 domain-containing protein [Dehalococcoidia bacterium]
MARPVRWRCVGFVPPATRFTPGGVPPQVAGEVPLSLEEIEAIRLRDHEGLQQEECARTMHISRPTFHRVLASARKKIADALTTGKAIRIEGGNFAMSRYRFRCGHDGHEWDVPFEDIVGGTPLVCPRCSHRDVQPVNFPLPFSGGGQARHRRRRGR